MTLNDPKYSRLRADVAGVLGETWIEQGLREMQERQAAPAPLRLVKPVGRDNVPREAGDLTPDEVWEAMNNVLFAQVCDRDATIVAQRQELTQAHGCIGILGAGLRTANRRGDWWRDLALLLALALLAALVVIAALVERMVG